MTIDANEVKRICVIQLGQLGDVFLTTSYFEALKRYLPNVHITFLVKANHHRILCDHPFIDELIVIPKAKGFEDIKQRINLLIKVAKAKFDVVLDHQYKPSSMYFSLASRAKYRIGLAGDRFTIPFSYTHTVPYDNKELRYSATQKFDLLTFLGIKHEPYNMYLTIRPEEQSKIDTWLTDINPSKQPIIVLSPGSLSEFKCWADRGFAEVADHFVKRGYKAILVWGPGEEKIVEAVQGHMQEDSYIAIPTTPQEAVALLKRASLFISNDGGITHLSVAAKVKTVTVFAGTEPCTWAPGLEFPTHAHLHNPNHENDLFKGVSVEEVIQIAENLLSS